MKEMKRKLMLLVMLCLLMFVEPVLARTNRKKAGPAPSRPASNRSALSSRSAPPRSVPSRSVSKQRLGSRSIPSVQRPASPRISSPDRLGQGPRIGKMPERRIRKSPSIDRPSINSRRSTLFESLSRSLRDRGSSTKSGFNRRSRKVTPGRETIVKQPDLHRRKEPSLAPHQDRGLHKFREDSGRYDHKWRYESPYRRHRYYVHYPFGRVIFQRIVWPSYYRPIYYDYGPYCTFGYVWPYYHRKYIFVSLGGYWPYYPYRRYYWYPCHPYRWYGDYPMEYVVPGDTYNYYYYGSPDQPIRVPVPDYDALGEVRKKLEEEPLEKPAEITQADRCFEKGVKTFEAGNYAAAVAKFQTALEQAPDDIVLPFAYVQALFADARYRKAAEVLREALSKVLPQEQGVFYPRGLYPDENILKGQIEQLSKVVKLNPFDSDLQLLLGYQLLGMGRFDEALEPLENAQKDYKNTQAATRLLGLLKELKKANSP